ncbi:MAG TPA: hypothetical protein VEA59_05415 [Patescibacteria group bacterium]|nr:hypothetical protein [Patescibacteria group bacterium]
MRAKNIILSTILFFAVIATVYVLKNGFTPQSPGAELTETETGIETLNMFPYGEQPLDFSPVISRDRQSTHFTYPTLTREFELRNVADYERLFRNQ